MLRQTEDGYLIAETDLRLRGAGELLGTKQSGLPRYQIADAVRDADLLELAHREARLIADQDETLSGRRGPALRILLHLFRRDQQVRFLRAG